MPLNLTLNDQELPASPAFIEFLHATLNGGKYYTGTWFEQEAEVLHKDEDRFAGIEEMARAVLADEQGAQWVLGSYRFFKEMLTGRPQQLRDVTGYSFFFVIGIPRTGGTYLTKQLFRAGNIDYQNVQNALAHDGFPHLSHLSFREQGNVHTSGLLQLAEYLTMVQVYFREHGRLAYHGGVVVPKKFTKAIYYFDLVRELFGDNTHYLITLRHPLSIIRSTLDKSGGMPDQRRFALRSAIERWAYDDWLHWGSSQEDILAMTYVECMLGYWKRFHFQLALCGVLRMPTTQVVPYGEQAMTEAVQDWYKNFGVELRAEQFKVAAPPAFNNEEEAAAQQAIDDVSAFWTSLGLEFPVSAIGERH